MSSIPSVVPVDLSDFFEVSETRANRAFVVNEPGLKVLHLTLAPGQSVPRHSHAGHQVLLHGLTGTVTLVFDDCRSELSAGQLCHLPGDVHVSPTNEGSEPAAMTITLAKVS